MAPWVLGLDHSCKQSSRWPALHEVVAPVNTWAELTFSPMTPVPVPTVQLEQVVALVPAVRAVGAPVQRAAGLARPPPASRSGGARSTSGSAKKSVSVAATTTLSPVRMTGAPRVVKGDAGVVPLVASTAL